MRITTHSCGYGNTSVRASRAVRILRKRYRIDEIAEIKGVKEIYFDISDYSSLRVNVYLDGKRYDFKKLELLKYKLPKKRKTLWQKLKEILSV